MLCSNKTIHQLHMLKLKPYSLPLSFIAHNSLSTLSTRYECRLVRDGCSIRCCWIHTPPLKDSDSKRFSELPGHGARLADSVQLFKQLWLNSRLSFPSCIALQLVLRSLSVAQRTSQKLNASASLSRTWPAHTSYRTAAKTFLSSTICKSNVLYFFFEQMIKHLQLCQFSKTKPWCERGRKFTETLRERESSEKYQISRHGYERGASIKTGIWLFVGERNSLAACKSPKQTAVKIWARVLTVSVCDQEFGPNTSETNSEHSLCFHSLRG